MHTKQADTFCIHFLVAEKRYQVEIKHYMENLKTTPPSPKSKEVPLFLYKSYCLYLVYVQENLQVYQVSLKSSITSFAD